MELKEKGKNEKEIKLLKEFLKMKPWRKNKTQHKNWVKFLDKLCEAHNVPKLQLVVQPRLPVCMYVPLFRGVALNKYSIVSLLHEFAHHIGKNESQAVNYSQHIFFTAYPEAKKNCEIKGGFVKKIK